MSNLLKILLTLITLTIITATFGCISNTQSTTTIRQRSTAETTQTSESLQPINAEVYKSWLHNSTEYFEIYYPEEVYKNPILQSKLNMLLLGADSTYESYSKLFGGKPHKAKIYLYPSKDSLKTSQGKT